jgi:hypothetical protein
MRHSFRVWLVFAAVIVGGGAHAKDGDKKAAAPAHEVNACGCYKDTAGACFCGKKGKCACPGDCEPKGCEAKREKEVAAETKKAAAADKKQRQSAHDASKPGKHETDGTGQ